MSLADPLVATRPRPPAWRSLGGSLLFHGLLVVLACWVVLRTPDRPAPRLREGPTQTAVETLTPAGRMVQAKVRMACEKGSLGAWLDRLLAEPYDALVVFSDFQDGVRLYETKKGEPKMVWSDSSYHKSGGAQKGQTRWQREWLDAFARAPQGRGPRLYLFSVQQEPQAFLRACVAASGGAWTSVSWLRKGGRKAP